MIVRDRRQLQARQAEALRMWWVFIGSCATGGLAGVGGGLLGWPAAIAGALVGAVLTVLALSRPELDS